MRLIRNLYELVIAAIFTFTTLGTTLSTVQLLFMVVEMFSPLLLLCLYFLAHSFQLENSSNPLFLTPYIERADILNGQKAAFVKPLIGNITSYAGFFTVNKKYNSNLFFWFFPAENRNESAPLLLWLQGGPGSSCLLAILKVNGPYQLDNNGNITMQDYPWTKKNNMLYIDSPVAAGFSFTDKEEGYATSQADISTDLYSALQQFFTLFPNYKRNDFYITGESFGAKCAFSLARTIDKNNENIENKINLKGIAVSQGPFDLSKMIDYADFYYQIGMIDLNAREYMKLVQDQVISFVDEKRYEAVMDTLNQLLYGHSPPSYFYNITGFSASTGNYLYNADINDTMTSLVKYCDSNEMRQRLHVGDTPFHHLNPIVQKQLIIDFSTSIKPWLEPLLDKYRVVLFCGQLDISVPYTLTLNFIKSLNWSMIDDYLQVGRILWYVDGELAGYTKTAGKFTEILLRKAGHLAVLDQSKWTYNLIDRVTNDIPFS